MAYVTGLVSNLTDLVVAIRDACTDNGWAAAGDVLYKDNVHVRIQLSGSVVTFLGGTGVDGSNNLTGAGPNVVRIRELAQAFTYPMTYEVHILTDPDEVYVIVNYAVDFYQWAAWGQSTVEGLPGTGVWYAASCHASNVGTGVAINASGSQLGIASSAHNHPALLSTSSASGGNAANTQNGYVQHGIDGEDWNVASPAGGNGLHGYTALDPLLSLLPSTWNNQTILLPVVAYRVRASSKVALLADLAHARHCRIDYHDPGDIITLGTDRWRLYPCYSKNASARNGGNGIQHSGTMGFAIRYTGP